MASSVQPRFGYPGSRVSYTCSAAVTAGQLVKLTADQTVAPATADATGVVGVAQHDVPASASYIGQKVVGDGNELTVLDDCFVELTASGSISAGDLLVPAASGKAATLAAAGGTYAQADANNARSVIGKAIEGAADGETFLAKVDC